MIPELLSDTNVQSLLLNLGASACWDFLKGSTTWIVKKENNDFDEAVTQTINYFSDGTIEILPEYFKKMFDDPEVSTEIQEFEKGIRDVSLTKLGMSFSKAGFYFPQHQTQKAEGIVNYFLGLLIKKILADPTRGPSILFETIQKLGKRTTDYGSSTIELLQKLQK